jgi:hypothetical protein
VIEKARRNEYEHANEDNDEVVCDLKFYQKNTHPAIGTTTLFSWDNYRVKIGSLKSEVIRKPIEMCKKTEKAIFQISQEFVEECKDEQNLFTDYIDSVITVHEDKELKNSDKYDKTKDIWAEIHMHRLYKTEDWFKDGEVLMKTIRKGKGRKPYADSTIYFRLRVEVDGKEVFSNFPKELSEI